MNYARRQQYRRLSRAGAALATSATAALLAFVAVTLGAGSLGSVFIVGSAALALYARHWLVLAGRSRVGARAEDEVRRTLASFRREGWRMRYSLSWWGRGDIDSVTIAPGGIGFAIETKTARYDDVHLATVWEQAAWLSHFRRRWCRRGVVPVLCVVRSRGVHRWEDGVLVVSIDRLIPAVRWTANLVHSARGSR